MPSKRLARLEGGLPRKLLCLFGRHNQTRCTGLRDERHMKWQRELRQRRYGATGRR